MAQVVMSSSSHSSSKIVGSKNENIEIIVLEMRVYALRVPLCTPGIMTCMIHL